MFPLHDPVIEIIVQMPVTFLEVEFLEHGGILHQVEAVVHVTSQILGQNQSVVDELLELGCGGHIDERVTSLN